MSHSLLVTGASGQLGQCVSDDFQELTGRQPQPFAEWVQQHKTRLAAL